jgi:hypothetical protein
MDTPSLLQWENVDELMANVMLLMKNEEGAEEERLQVKSRQIVHA